MTEYIKLNKYLQQIVNSYVDYSLKFAYKILKNEPKITDFNVNDLLFKSIHFGYVGFWISTCLEKAIEIIDIKIIDEKLTELITKYENSGRTHYSLFGKQDKAACYIDLLLQN